MALFTSEASGIAIIEVKSKGLIGDTVSIAVLPPKPALTPTSTPAPTTPAPTEAKFRVEPTVRLRPVVDVIEKNQDGIVELYMDNPTLNDVILNVVVLVGVPSGIHVYGQGFGLADAAGVVMGTFEVPPGIAKTINVAIKADKSARIGSHSLQFTGLYYPSYNNKDNYQPISITYSVNVMEASEEPRKPQATPEPAMKVPGFTGVLVLIGLVAAIVLLRRR